jgi:hypothetical protein
VLSGLAASAGTSRTVTVTADMLSGNGFFASARASVGLAAPGLPPMSVRALNHFRSAPPLITPLATGLTMEPVNLPAPPVVAKPPERAPVALDNPRLRAVLQSPLVPVADTPPALHTTVARVAPPGAVRLAAPQPVSVSGARLERIAAPNAPAPTGLGRLARTLRNPDFGWSAGVSHSGALQQAESSVLRGEGATVGAGATHVWDLPAQRPRAVNLQGSAGARVTFLTRGGGVLGDRELLVSDQSSVPIPAEAAGVAIGCLGKTPDRINAPGGGFAALSFETARSGADVACGWQSANMLVQVGPGALLGRGACVVLSRATVTSRGRQSTTQAVVRALDTVGDLAGVETWLPASVGVVMVLLDQQDPTAASDGDLSIAADGATLAVPPARVVGGRRKALLYDVVDHDRTADHLVVAVASRAAWRVAGVVGLPGRAQEWAVRFNGNLPEHLVPDGPLTPDGRLTVRFE